MIKYIKGDLLESPADALVNAVNTVGVMGKGIALQFKQKFPNNYKVYRQECKAGQVEIGKLLVVSEANLMTGEKIIINFPTKKHWRGASTYAYIVAGLQDLVQVIKTYELQSIAIPPLGCGNGGLHWELVRPLIEQALKAIDIEIYIYEPI